MKKKMYYLAIIPIFGSVILLFCSFIKMIRQEIDKKKFHAYFVGSALLGFLSILSTVLVLTIVNSFSDISSFINDYGAFVIFVVGGYLMNLMVFALMNKSGFFKENSN